MSDYHTFNISEGAGTPQPQDQVRDLQGAKTASNIADICQHVCFSYSSTAPSVRHSKGTGHAVAGWS